LLFAVHPEQLVAYDYSFNITVKIGENVELWLGELIIDKPFPVDVIIGVVSAAVRLLTMLVQPAATTLTDFSHRAGERCFCLLGVISNSQIFSSCNSGLPV